MADLLDIEESALNDVERKRHLAAIERLTEQCGVPRIEVGKRYEEELEKILNKLKKYKRNQGEMIDIQAFRELTLYTRKYIILYI